MTTGPEGSPVRADDRLSEILSRYADDDPVHRAITLSAPLCLPPSLALTPLPASQIVPGGSPVRGLKMTWWSPCDVVVLWFFEAVG
jgi:hypothetical protein